MRRKYAGLILLFFVFSISNVFSANCFFDTYSSECQRILTPYNDFSLDINSGNEFSDIEVEVFNTDNPSNKLVFERENFQISQVMPFLEPGTYSINVKAYDRAGNFKEKSFEYVFDNTEPMPPIVPIGLKSDSQTITVEGKAQPGLRVAADVRGVAGSQQTFATTASDDGKFSLRLNLKAGTNYVRFYTLRANNLKSAYTERVILSGEIKENPSLNVNSLSLDNLEELNERTVGRFTTKRNFYVQGTATGAAAGTLVYVNGVKAVVDQNGKFATFVLLNQGKNSIVAKSGNVESAPKEYDLVDLEFNFKSIEYDKVVSSPSSTISGEVSFDYPFLVFLNGKYLMKIHPSNYQFSIPLSNLDPGKNFIELRGINNERIFDVIYYDTQNPIANIITSKKQASNPKIGFQITDDIAINISSLALAIDNNILEADALEVKGGFYIFDISGLKKGDYSYLLKGKDISGKEFTSSGQINVNPENTLIENIISEAEMIGNHIYTKTGNIKMTIIPSRNIAFKSIYLDDVEQTDYEILSNNNVKLDVEIEEKSGSLDVVFINQDYSEFAESFIYHSDKETPIIKLDYIGHPYTTDKVKITGEIIDDNFDWLTLTFNNQKSFTRYGNYFEAIIDVDNANLKISGSDFAGNSFIEDYGYLLYRDESSTEVYLSRDSDKIKDSIKGSLPTSDEHKEHVGVLNFIDSYDGFDLGEVYIASDKFELPVQDRPGFRSLNLRGYESSSLKFYSDDYIRVLPVSETVFRDDGSSPQIYFNGNNNQTLDSDNFVQGNILSSAPIVDVQIDKGRECVFDNTSFVCDVGLKDGDNTFVVTVWDSEGRETSKAISIEKAPSDLRVSLNDIFGEYLHSGGSENYLFGESFYVDGSVNRAAIISIFINGNEVLDGVHNGEFEKNLDLSEVIDGTDKSELSIQLKAEDDYGNIAFSNKIKVLYQRVFETFAKVLVR